MHLCMNFDLLLIFIVRFMLVKMFETNFVTAEQDIETIVNRIFGTQVGSTYKEGLIDAESEEVFYQKLEDLRLEWEEVEGRNAACRGNFYDWFNKYKLCLVCLGPYERMLVLVCHHQLLQLTCDYHFDYRSVCKDAFILLHDIGTKQLKNLQKHLRNNGPIAREHGLIGRMPATTYPYSIVSEGARFIRNYAEVYGIPQPAKKPSNLPPCITKLYDCSLQICGSMSS